MKKIGLIDVDSHNFPNLALMKISAYHKQKGDTVEWAMPLDTYKIVYQSKVFDETYSPEIMWEPQADKIIKGCKGGVTTELFFMLAKNLKIIRSDYMIACILSFSGGVIFGVFLMCLLQASRKD